MAKKPKTPSAYSNKSKPKGGGRGGMKQSLRVSSRKQDKPKELTSRITKTKPTKSTQALDILNNNKKKKR